MFKLSLPTKKQIIAGIERVVAVFLISDYTVWARSNYTFSKATAIAGVAAGATAVYGLIKSFLTDL